MAKDFRRGRVCAAGIILRTHNKTVQVCCYAGILGGGNQVLLRAVKS